MMFLTTLLAAVATTAGAFSNVADAKAGPQTARHLFSYAPFQDGRVAPRDSMKTTCDDVCGYASDGSSCEADDPNWQDTVGDSCAGYAAYSGEGIPADRDWCINYGHIVDQHGISATEACCVTCGSSAGDDACQTKIPAYSGCYFACMLHGVFDGATSSCKSCIEAHGCMECYECFGYHCDNTQCSGPRNVMGFTVYPTTTLCNDGDYPRQVGAKCCGCPEDLIPPPVCAEAECRAASESASKECGHGGIGTFCAMQESEAQGQYNFCNYNAPGGHWNPPDSQYPQMVWTCDRDNDWLGRFECCSDDDCKGTCIFLMTAEMNHQLSPAPTALMSTCEENMWDDHSIGWTCGPECKSKAEAALEACKDCHEDCRTAGLQDCHEGEAAFASKLVSSYGCF